MSFLHQAKTYLRHWLLEVDEHSIHSPFFFDFYTKVLHDTSSNADFSKLEKLHTDLLSNSSSIADESNGREKGKNSNKLSLGEIAQTLTPQHYYELYYRIIRHLKAKKVIEVGTSVGLNTLYLAEQLDCQVYTFEQSHALANVAITNFEYLDKKNIHLIEGNNEIELSDFLQDTGKVNFVVMNATRYESIVKQFNLLMKRTNEKSIIAINNIHQTEEIDKAWLWLKANELVYGSIDLYECGILFFEPSLNKQHFIFSLSKK